MIKTNKLFGAILIISGTTIGAGMLGLPIATSFSGFFPTLVLFILCWFLMMATGFIFLEVNLNVKGDVNLITMAEDTLGRYGRLVTWITYLLLLYSITAAYFAVSSTLFLNFFKYVFHVSLPETLGPLFIIFLFGPVIYFGTKLVDYINRYMMLGLIISFFLLVFFVPSHVNYKFLTHVDFKPLIFGIPIIIASFGYHIVIPSLVTYMKRDEKKLRLAIIIGSLIPFIVYIIWEFLILGTVPLLGDFGLGDTMAKQDTITYPLSNIIKSPLVSLGASLFAFFAIVTSFLGVGMGLVDFLIDGMRLERVKMKRLISSFFAYLPPLIFIYIYPKGFYIALYYAALFVAILLTLLPPLMALKLPKPNRYCSFWGRFLLFSVILISVFIIVISFMYGSGWLNPLIAKYLK